MHRQGSIAVLVMATAFALFVLTGGRFWLTNAVAQPEILPAAKGDQCVAETQFMRENHMKMLDHQRDETVIDGVRGNPFSLVGCVDCHAQRDADNKPVRIDAEGQFCESCHTYAAVKIDCFSCHAAIPDDTKEVIGHFDVFPYFPNLNFQDKPQRIKHSMISASFYSDRERNSLSHLLAFHFSDSND